MQEYLLIATVGLFIGAQILNGVAGPVKINITSPLQFFSPTITSRYPLTTVEVIVRSLALAMTVVLILSFINKKYFLKIAVCVVVGGIGILYAIQQLANQGKITPLQWTLAFAGGGAMLVLPIIYYFIRGIVEGIYSGLTKNKTSSPVQSTQQETTANNNQINKNFWGE